MEETARPGKDEILLCRTNQEYRQVSQLAAAKNTGLFRHGPGDILLQSDLAARIAAGAITVARGLGLNADLLTGVQTNLNLLRGAVHEAGSWESFRTEFWMRLPVLMYHHVGKSKGGPFPELTIEPIQFAQQMQWLDENGYAPITAADWLHWCNSGARLPAKPILITFDDAYDDLVRYAFPVLQEHKFPATVFVPTAYAGRSNIWDQRKGSAPIEIMTASTISEWAGKGIEFGAHSRTHPALDNIDPVALEDELAGSREDLEKIIDAPVVSFAYPYGNHNCKVREATGRSFRLAFTTEDGINTLGTDLLQLRRTMVKPGQSMVDFASRVWFGHSIPENAKARVRRVMGV